MEILTRNRSTKDERTVRIGLTEKGKDLKKLALPIPDKLVKTLLTENIQLTEVLQLKEMLNEWINILSETNEK